jgi:hypothetical protein
VGDVSAVEQALYAAVKYVGHRQGGLSRGGGSYRRRLVKYPRLPYGSIEKGIRVRCTQFRFSVVP